MEITTHKLIIGTAKKMTSLKKGTIDLIITSPPYPMISMWDDMFCEQNKEIETALQDNSQKAFELMHRELDKVWAECFRVLRPSGFLCINIGDAIRKIADNFRIYNNSARVISFCEKCGFTPLPNIIWRKTTNAPNKFMGSGMLPCGAYVTLEHENILIFRKGGKRVYKTQEEKQERMRSSIFWEERNTWFSDIWEICGVKQDINIDGMRQRTAAYPIEIPYRLINMYSQRGDIVLDPFVGTGTTSLAAIISQRNSIGIEIDDKLEPLISQRIGDFDVHRANKLMKRRYTKHRIFVEEHEAKTGNPLKHFNENIGQRVVTKQECLIPKRKRIVSKGKCGENLWKVYYE